MAPTETRQLDVQIKTHAFNRLTWRERQASNLFLSDRIVPAGASPGPGVNGGAVDRPSILVFVDDNPLTGYGHPCRYLLYDAQTGAFYREIQAQFPPYETAQGVFRAFHRPVQSDDPLRAPFFVNPTRLCPILHPDGERYAILFSGMSWTENLNNHEFCYRMLIDRYAFKPQNICVLRYDGTLNTINGPAGTWPGDGTPYRMQVTGPGTRAALQGAFNDLRTKLQLHDLLFIHTENEAGTDGNGHAFFATWPDWGGYSAADFATDLSTLPHYRSLIALAAQCYAGGFSSAFLTGSTAANTSVSCATTPTRGVAETPDGRFVEFGKDWLSAQMGHDPYGAALAYNPDTDGDGVIEAEEAFNYAYTTRNTWDFPNFHESSEAGGDITLGQRYEFWRWWCWLVLPILERYPLPEASVHELVPRLRDIAIPVIDRAARDLRAELEPKATAIIQAALGAPTRI